ncbi:TPA: hypothetical protein VA736_002373 [Streptococcus agalactiae]|nr:hypothetical protein [Streptococcus agalactiae]HEO6038501.1 hypothetical protein [Streptococcus agalactiae]HEO6040403.1 hypothetical protein [Streptococcus agalactiae]
MGIFIAGYFLLILSGIVFYYLISTYSVKISAFFIDFIVVGLGFYISTKDKLDNKLAIPLSITVVIIYGIMLVLINQKLPKVSKFLNYIIAFIGSSVALWLALDFITSTLIAFKIIGQTYHQLPITKSMMINSFIHYVIVFLISILVFKGRMKFIIEETYE